MSEKATSLPSLVEMLAQRKRKDNLTNKHINFLLCWHETMQPKIFGFRGVPRLDDQLTRAITLLKDSESAWESRTQNNETSLQFHQFFIYTAVSEGVDLPADFEERYIQLIKGD